MRNHKVLPPGAKQTDAVRAELKRLEMLFPDPDAGRDPLELIERDVADLKVFADEVLSGGDAAERAAIRLSIRALQCRVDMLDLLNQRTLMEIDLVEMRTTERMKRPAARAAAPAPPASGPAFMDVTPPTWWERVRVAAARAAAALKPRKTK